MNFLISGTKSLITVLFLLISTLPLNAELEKFNEKVNGAFLYGLKDGKGKVIVPAKYASILEIKNMDKMVYYKLKDHKGYLSLIDPQGKTIVKLDDYDNISFPTFSNDFVIVSTGGRQGVYNVAGKKIIPPIFQDIITNQKQIDGKWVINSFTVKLNGKTGLYDVKGKCLIEPEYDYISTSDLGKPFVSIQNEIYYGLYDMKAGKVLISPNTFTNYIKDLGDGWFTSSVGEGTVALFKGDKEIFRGKGSKILKGENETFDVYYSCKDYLKKEAAEGNIYKVDLNGNIIEEVTYKPVCIDFETNNKETLEYFSDSNMKWGVRNKAKRVIIPCEYDNVKYNSQLNCYELFSGKYQGLSDLKGKIIITPDKYNSIKYDSKKNYYEVKKEGKQGIVDISGLEIIPPLKYDYVSQITDYPDIFIVRAEGKTGVINNKNEEIVSPFFEYLKMVTHNPVIGPYFEVRESGKKGIFGINGECLVPASFTEVMIHDPKYFKNITDPNFAYIETTNYQYKGIFDLHGNEIIPATTATKILYRSEFTDMPYFSLTNGSGHSAIFDLNGNVLFPFQEYEILSLVADKESSTGYSIMASEKLMGRTLRYELYTGKILSDNKNEIDFHKFVVEGDKNFSDGNYSKAEKSYTSAMNLKNKDYIVFNRGLSRYNQGKYQDAISDFKRFKTMTTDVGDLERADNLISKAQNLQQEKEERQSQLVNDLLGFAFAVVNVATLPKVNKQNYTVRSESGSTSNYSTNSSDNYSDSSSLSSVGNKKKKCGFCGGRGSIVEYTSNFGINNEPYCSECGKNVTSGHYHKTCTKCNGAGEY